MQRFNVYFRLLLLLFALASMSLRAQEWKNPALYPYTLFEKGDVALPDSLPEVLAIHSHKMDLRDIPQKYPYRTVAYFDSGQLLTLHVVFNDTGVGLPFDDYVAIRGIFINLWKEYPNKEYNGRYDIKNKSWIWETHDFRIEWIYQNQPGSESKKMGWLYMYSRHKRYPQY